MKSLMDRARGARGALGALAIALVLITAAMLVAGASPIDGFAALFAGALGGTHQLGETLVQATALLFPALGIALAFRAGLFNIGAEGQLLVGGLAAGALGANVHLAPALAAVIMLGGGALAGGVWGGIAGWLKARFGANEIIATLMLNFIAASLTGYLVAGPLKSSPAGGPETAPLAHAYWLPVLLPYTRLSIALLIALAIAALLHVVLTRTVFGYELRAIGEAPEAARRAGISLQRMALLALASSGAIAGLGGASIVAGELHRFNTQLSPGYGYTAIAVALVGDLDARWICVAAFAFGILETGGLAMQAVANIPKDAIHVIEGVIVVLLAARRYVAARAAIAS